MSIRIETPPTLNGETEAKFSQLARYLFRLSETLNVVLSDVRLQNTSGTNGSGAADGMPVAGGTSEKGSAYEELKALIVNTATMVRLEEKRLRDEFTSRYTAISDDWGRYQQDMSRTVEETARGVVDSYGYDASISTLAEQAAGFANYQTHTEGFIRQGFIDYDSDGVPIIGIAIGQNLTSTEVIIGGESYRQFDANQSCAFYTSDRVSFRLNGNEVAYISNRKLYIGDASITGTMALGGKWQISHANGFTVKWIGS